MAKVARILALPVKGNAALVLRIVLSLLFIAAGVGKLIQGNQFLLLAGYQFLPQSVAYPLDLILPWAELTLGILLLTGYYYRFVLAISILFMATFIGANSYSLLTGSSAQCNCFGGILPLTHGQSLWMDIGMLLISGVLLASSSKTSSPKLRLRIPQQAWLLSRASLLSLVLIVVSLPSITSAAAPDSGAPVTYSTMKLTPDQLAQREAGFRGATSIAVSPRFKANVASAPPASFSLLPHLQYTPAQRNQGSVGNCWVWAGTGIMEIALDVNNSIKDRLSIQYFDSNYSNGWAGCGGWLGQLVAFYNNPATDQAIPWSNYNANYQDASRGGCPNTASVPASSIVTTPNYPTTNGIQVVSVPTTGVGAPAAIANIQTTLLQNKAIEFDFDLPTTADWNTFFNFWGSQPETAIWTPKSSYGNADSGAAGHGVLCVGYDQTDPNNPYWVMLNSWGTTSGRPNGLFRVSMNMNYDASYRSSNHNYQSFWWSTLDNVFAPGSTPEPAAKLAFTIQPSATNTEGMAFGIQPVVTVQDAGGNTVATSDAAVALAITAGTGTNGAVLGGSTTVNAVNGVATFSGLSLNLAGTGYTLTAASPTLTSATSANFNVSSASVAPTLSSPANGASVPGNSITYSWNALPGATLYSIYVSPSPNFSTIKFNYCGNNTFATDTGYPNNGTTYYWVVYAWNGTTWSPNSAVWSLINVSVAAKVAFTAQPGASNTAGTAFGSQPVVKIQDAGGNTVTTSNAAVNLAITAGTGTSGAILSGTTTVNAVNGMATFSGLSLDLAGTSYTLTATSPGLSSATSAGFNVSSASTGPTLSSPANGARVSGNSITYNWNAVSGATAYSIYVSPSPSFNTIKFNYCGSNTFATDTGYPNNGTPYYWVVYAWNGTTWSPSSAVWSLVNAPGTAAKLAFTTQPSTSNTAGTAFGSQPVVKIQDAGGNTVTTSSAAVTLAITAGTGTSGAVLSSSTTVNAVNGVATFSGLKINLAGTNYTLTATSPSLTSATSAGFNVSAASAGPTLSSPANGARVSGNSITYNWNALPGATLYSIYVSPSRDFSTIKFNYCGSNTFATDTGYLNNGTTYYWVVYAWNGTTWSPSSAVWSLINGP